MRLLIAMSVSRPVREYLMGRVRIMRRQMHSRSWVPIQNYHLTLHFLGDCQEVDLICYAMQKTARHIQTMELKAYAISSIARPRSAMLVADVMDTENCLQEVHHDLKVNLMDMGLIADRRNFSPHITLARSLPKQEVEQYQGSLDGCPTWTASNITLYDSSFVDGHMVYTPIHTQLLRREHQIQPCIQYIRP